MPVIRLKSVVLPAPFGPISETISPSLTSMSRSETTRRPPNESETLLELEQRHQTISTRFSPSRPLGRSTIRQTSTSPMTMYRVGSGFASITFSHTNAAR